MKLIFISSGQYPNGGAATNRHLAYAKGLKELGHDVAFFLLSKQQWNGPEMAIDGIRLLSVHVPARGAFGKIGKIRSHLKTLRKTKEGLLAAKNKDAQTRLILLDVTIPILVPLLRYGKKIHLKIFHERTEYPFVVSRKTIPGRIDLYVYLKFLVKKFDGIYVINNALQRYFTRLTNGKVPVVIINMIVDPARFECSTKPGKDSTITFCGNLDGEKDGVPILLEAFAHIMHEFPLVKLQLIGSLQNPVTRQNIESRIEKSGMHDRVILTGSVKRDDIPGMLCSSGILALARPANKQAEGGFPTKLGEYLATGNVVVVTNVGEIGSFLKDRENAFVAEPDSAAKFADKLREALLDNDRSRIGAEGKKLVYNEFNYLTQARVLESLFTEP